MVRRSETIGGMDAFTTPPAPINEPNLTYAPGTPERAALELELKRQEDQQVDLTATIGGAKKMGGGAEIPVVQPHDHAHVLGVMKNATREPLRSSSAFVARVVARRKCNAGKAAPSAVRVRSRAPMTGAASPDDISTMAPTLPNG